MATLCHLFDVPFAYFDQKRVPESMREVDFYIMNNDKYYRCEIKLMGKGNPESADAIFARESNILIADKLSTLNKQQAEKLNVHWVEMRARDGYQRFKKILTDLNIPHAKIVDNIEIKMENVLNKLIAGENTKIKRS